MKKRPLKQSDFLVKYRCDCRGHGCASLPNHHDGRPCDRVTYVPLDSHKNADAFSEYVAAVTRLGEDRPAGWRVLVSGLDDRPDDPTKFLRLMCSKCFESLAASTLDCLATKAKP